MKNFFVPPIVLALALTMCLAAVSSVAASGMLKAFEHSNRRAIYWDFLRLDEEPPRNMNISSGVHATAVVLPLNSRMNLFGQWTFSAIKYTDGKGDPNDFVGSPLIGVQLDGRGVNYWEIGCCLPLGSGGDDARSQGLVSDALRMSSFADEHLSFSGMAHIGSDHGQTSTFWDLGMEVMVPVASDLETEVIFDYGFSGVSDLGGVSAFASLSGRYIPTRDGSVGDRTTHRLQVGLRSSGKLLGVGFRVILPIDEDYSRTVNFGYAFQMSAYP